MRHGFASTRLSSRDARIVEMLGTTAGLVQPGMPAGQADPSAAKFGGGRSGGAGTTGGW